MRISLYSESPDPGPGGAEQFVAVLAEALSEAHEVSIVHHKAAAVEDGWANYSGCDLRRVKFRHVPCETDASSCSRTPWGRYRAAREWRRAITEDSDLFIGLLHNRPPFCRARLGALIVLFPTYEPQAHFDDCRETRTKKKPAKSKKKKKSTTRPEGRDFFAWAALRRGYSRWEWRRRMASYGVKLSISAFSREWTKTRWGIESEVLHPPVQLPRSASAPKADRILSVGRFATTGHTKKQIELLEAFRGLRAELPGWSYSSLGGLNEMPHDCAYFEQACEFRETNRVEVQANIGREELQRQFVTSKIFWHAAGFGNDLSTQPEMAEHFGLSTVEAMAHGCVPVVINLGGQREIVEHGVSGFLWDSLEELQDHTRRLAADSELLQRMSAAARRRAEAFSRETCVKNLLRYVGLDPA